MEKWTLKELVIVAVIGVAVGIFWMGWTLVYELISPILRFLALNYLFAGVWYLGGTLSAYIVRKPGAAVFGELMAAAAEMMLTHWGFIALIWGLAQGLAVELVLFIFGYKKWDIFTMMLAGAFAGLAAYALDYFFYGYHGLAYWIIVLGIVNSAVGGAIGSGWLAKALADALIPTGTLEGLKIRGK
jgi:energy-coupling factor transport system substrate-specific component